jgi:mRNA turnover protein 4
MSLPPPKKISRVKAKIPEKTQSRGRTRKSELIDDVQRSVDEYENIYVFDVQNMRTSPFKALRLEFREDGRFLMGKNGVVRVALGRTREEAYRPQLEVLSSKLEGEVGVLFTKRPHAEVLAYFEAFRELDFARAGFKAERNVDVPAGPLVGQPSSMVESLRGMRLPVVLSKGVVVLEKDHRVCTAGEALSAEQARALKFFGVQMSEFKVKLRWRWSEEMLEEL